MPGRSMVMITNEDETYTFKNVLTNAAVSRKNITWHSLMPGTIPSKYIPKDHDIKTNFYVYNKPQGKVIFVK